MLIPNFWIFLKQLLSFLWSIFRSFTRKHSFFQLRFSFSPHFFFPFLIHIQKFKSIVNEILFYHFIKRCISRKRRSVIDFENLWLKFMIQDNIKTKNFKTHVIRKVLRMTTLLASAQSGISCNDGFDNDVVNSLFCLLTAVTQFIKGFVNWRKWSFMTFVTFLKIIKKKYMLLLH